MSQANAENSTSASITRRAVEAQIDALIDLLDTLDPDPDLEPSLGFTEYLYNLSQADSNHAANANAGDDREADDEREPTEDSEHSLGWTDNPNQASPHWHANESGELESGTGPVRKQRPPSKTGGDVYRGCGVLGVPPRKKSRAPTVLRVRPKVAR